MAMVSKSDPLEFLDIGRVYPRIERRVVSSPLDKMLFNTVIVTCAYYFIYLELGLGRQSNIDKLVIVKLSFDKPIM